MTDHAIPTAFERAGTLRAVLATLLVAAAIPYFVGLGASTIWDANEAFYAETARQMVETGDYVNPSFNGQPRFNKPVLSYWAVAASYRLFGVSEASERLPIAAAGVVLMATAFLLGGVVAAAAGHRPRLDPASFNVVAGLVAALILATSPRVLMFSRRIIIDVWLTMFMGLTLLGFVLAETCARSADETAASGVRGWRRVLAQPRARYLLFMYAAAGFGMLTKGPVAVVLPGLAFFVYLALDRRLRDVRHLMIPAGALVVAVIVGPWYVALYTQHGWVYIREFFIDENLMRYAEPVGASGRSVWFYPPVMLSELFPWSLALPAALVAAWPAVRRRPPEDQPSRRAVRVLFVWIAAIVLFFSFSRSKQDLYIFPIVMAEAALIAALLTAAFRTGAAGARWSLAAGAGLVVVGGLVLLFGVVWPGRFDLAGLLPAALVATAGGLLATGLAWRRRLAEAVMALAATFVALSWTFVLLTLPDVERYKPVAPLVAVIAERAGPDARIGYYRFGWPSMTYYARRPVFEALDPASLGREFGAGGEVYCLITAEDYEAVRESLPGPTYVVARHPLFDARTSTVLEGRAMPDVLVVSNEPSPKE